MRGVIAAGGLGRDTAILADLSMPTDRGRRADPETLGGFTAGGSRLDRGDDATAKVKRQSCCHGERP